jgi:hypothetical protein
MPFFLLKGLSFLPFGGLLKNPKVLIGLIIVALLAFGYFKWKSSIKEAIYNEIFAEQVEQHMENQRKELERVRQLMEESNQAVNEAQTTRQKILKEIDDARALTRNVTPERNGEVAPVLSEALDFIRARETSSEPHEDTLTEKLDNVVDTGLKALRDAQESVESTGNSAIDAWKKKQAEGL